jgi:hypothetical protein
VKYVSFPIIPSRHQRWETTAVHFVGRHSRPFTEHLEVRRFLQLPSSKRSSTWKERRKHAPFSEAVPQSVIWMPSTCAILMSEHTANACGD